MENAQINQITFSVPARRFVIDASVTVEESLPKVTEFVLRLIRLCDGLSSEEIAAYFGFSSRETRLILSSLQDQSLIAYEGELVRLTEYADSKFYTDDDLPRFSVVKSRTDIVDFDLLSFNPIERGSEGKAPGFAFALDVSEEQTGASAKLAEQAYQKHFQKILRMRERGAEKMDIYKMSNIQSKRFLDMPLQVSFSLRDDCEIERSIAYNDDAAEDFRLTVEASVSDALRRPLSAQTGWLNEFVERFDDKVIGQYLSRQGFDFSRYLRDVFITKRVAYPGHTQAILGNLYMPENQTVISTWLNAAVSQAEQNTPAGFVTSAAWMIPDYSFWGRTLLFDTFYWKLQSQLPQLSKPKKRAVEHIHILCPGTRETTWSLEPRFWSSREKGRDKQVHFFDGDVMGARVEVFFVPTRMAVVLFHYSPPGNSSALVPFGFVTSAPDLIKEAQVLLMDSTASGHGYVGKAQSRQKSEESDVVDTFDEHLGFLRYCSA